MLHQCYTLHQLTSEIKQSGKIKIFNCAASNASLGTLHSSHFVFHTAVAS